MVENWLNLFFKISIENYYYWNDFITIGWFNWPVNYGYYVQRRVLFDAHNILVLINYNCQYIIHCCRIKEHLKGIVDSLFYYFHFVDTIILILIPVIFNSLITSIIISNLRQRISIYKIKMTFKYFKIISKL